MKKDKWIWMGHAGHFICADKCRFHLNTYVGGYIVSTVGEYWPERAVREIHARVYNSEWHRENNHLLGDNYDAAYMKRFGFEEIGCGRTYETMVFKAKKTDYICCPWQMSGAELDFLGYNNEDEASKGHMKLCNKWSNK